MFIFPQFLTFYSILETRFLLKNECMIKKKFDKWFSSVHTFGIPNPCCPRDILDESSTNERCNGSEMRGCTYLKMKNNACKCDSFDNSFPKMNLMPYTEKKK